LIAQARRLRERLGDPVYGLTEMMNALPPADDEFMPADNRPFKMEAEKMDADVRTQAEKTFLSLPREEREVIISHGTALRLSELRKRLFLAESKVRHFEGKYKVTLAQLDADGLPDDAGYEMHEDYIMWHHWAEVADKVKSDIVSLEEIVQQGLYVGELSYAGY